MTPRPKRVTMHAVRPRRPVRPFDRMNNIARRRSRTTFVSLLLIVAALTLAPLAGCGGGGAGGGTAPRTLSLAVNSGVEGDALKAAARDYEAQTGVRVQ